MSDFLSVVTMTQKGNSSKKFNGSDHPLTENGKSSHSENVIKRVAIINKEGVGTVLLKFLSLSY